MSRLILAVIGAASITLAVTGCAATHASTASRPIPTLPSGGPSQTEIAPWLAPLVAPTPKVPSALSLFFPTAPTTPEPTGEATPDQFVQILTAH
jgi:hypothetical protein